MSDQGHPFKKPLQTRANTQPLREFVVGAPEPQFINNPAMSQPMQVTQEQMDRLTASQPSSSPMSLEDARAASNAARAAQAQVGSLSRQRIGILAGIGRMTRDVIIGEYTFSIRTLKAHETKEASLASIVGAKNDMEVGFESRRQQLARAIFAIDGHSVEETLASNDFQSRLDMIDDMEEIVVKTLWDTFAILKDESNKQFGLKSQADVEEVVADIKK
jgi:hypothetical protein